MSERCARCQRPLEGHTPEGCRAGRAEVVMAARVRRAIGSHGHHVTVDLAAPVYVTDEPRDCGGCRARVRLVQLKERWVCPVCVTADGNVSATVKRSYRHCEPRYLVLSTPRALKP